MSRETFKIPKNTFQFSSASNCSESQKRPTQKSALKSEKTTMCESAPSEMAQTTLHSSTTPASPLSISVTAGRTTPLLIIPSMTISTGTRNSSTQISPTDG